MSRALYYLFPVVLVVVLLSGAIYLANTNKKGVESAEPLGPPVTKMDQFAQCLREKEVTMYGAD